MIKRHAIYNWIKLGLKPEHFEHAWSEYEKSTCCDWCAQDYKSNRDKNMDHCHNSGDFRNILCHTCNNWRNNSDNISYYFNKVSNKWYYQVRFYRYGKQIVKKPYTFQTREEAEARLLEFKRNNWWYFPFEDLSY